MENIHISRIDTNSPDYPQVFDLRDEMLRKPLGMSLKNDDLSRDYVDMIFMAKHEGKVIGCVMLHHKDEDHLQLRQMAVSADWQGKGIGRLIVLEAELYAREAGYKIMVLHARKTALGFYQRLGYTVTSEEFLEVGIPHYIMQKEMEPWQLDEY